MTGDNQVIKIGLDFHGVINNNPEYFKEFTCSALSRGWEIHIITGGPYAKVEAMLADYGIKYTTIFAIFDFYNRQGLASIRPNGEFKINSQLWDTAKGKYCRVNHISLHVDDSNIYAKDFSTPFCAYDADNKSCTLNDGCIINLNLPLSETLDEIAKFLYHQCHQA